MNPFILNRADPFILKQNGVYYFTASVPSYDCIELRSSETLNGLKNAVPKIIWIKHQSGIMSEHVWAPEIHFLFGKWYIHFASSDVANKWELRPYVLQCDGDPMVNDWKEVGQMRGADEDCFSFTDFSLDGTVFEHNGENYYIWAEKVGRQHGISNLYLAKMASPSKLSTVQVLLSTPDYDWERIGFWVNEDAAVLKHNGKIYVTYSASATGHEYCMGMLSCDENCDILNPNNWSKQRYPVLKSSEKQSIFGTGHNCFTQDDQGNLICVFHARQYKDIVGDPLYDKNRHTFFMKVKFDTLGTPIFDYKDRHQVAKDK